MTLAATAPTVAPPQAQQPAPFLDGDKPALHTHTNSRRPRLVIIAREWCPECDGEKSHECIQTSGGRAGQITPDSWTVPCDRCDARGYVTRSRCVICGHLHDIDEWGIEQADASCECEPDVVLAAVADLGTIENYLSFHALSITLAKAAGLSVSEGVHGVPWRYWRALVARHGLKPERFVPAPGNGGGFYTAQYTVGEHTFPTFTRPNPWL